MNNGRINNNHGKVDQLLPRLVAMVKQHKRKLSVSQLFRNAILSSKTLTDRDRIADLIIYIDIDVNSNTIKECLIVPYLCTFNVEKGNISNKGGEGTNVMVALRNPKDFQSIKDLIEYIDKGLTKPEETP